MTTPPRAAVLTLLVSTGALIALSTTWAKLAPDQGIAPLPFLTWALLGAATLLAVLQRARGRLPRLDRRTLEYFLVAGLVSLAAPNLLLFAAIAHVGAAFVVLALAFPPLFTYLGALALRMERFDAARAVGVLAALGGAALLAVRKLDDPAVDPVWIAATLAAPVILAAGNLYRTARWPTGARPDELAPGMLAGGGLLLAATGLVGSAFSDAAWLSLAAPSGRGAWLVTVAQMVTFAATYVLFFMLQHRGGPVVLSLIGSVAAVVGVPLAVVFLGEEVPDGLVVGGLAIALGVALVTRPPRER